MGTPGAFLEDLTWPEAAERLAAGAVVLVPVGAAAKEHGPHLPLDTDWRIARALAERVAAALPVLVAPVVGFGYYPAFTGYPGSQHLRAETFIALIEDLVGNLIDHGATRIAILNTGVSTEAPLRIAARDILERRDIRVATADLRTLGRGADRLLQQAGGGHADERETSLMLAIAPEAVRLERAEREEEGERGTASAFQFPAMLSPDPARLSDFSRTGATGDPTLATREKGEAILAEIVRELVEGLQAAFPVAFDRA